MASSFEFLPSGGGTAKKLSTVPAIGDLPSGVPEGSIRYVEANDITYTYDGASWSPIGVGGGTVVSVNTLTGVVTLQVGDNSIGSTGATSQFAIVNGAGGLDSYPSFATNAEDGVNVYSIKQPNNGGGETFSNWQLDFDPLQNSPNVTWSSLNTFYNIDPNLSGFSFGSAGEAVVHSPVTFNAQGSGDVGSLTFIKNNFTVGNGTDPFDWRGMGYSFGFGQIAANVNLTESMQGYGFQWNMNALATTDTVSTIAFYDNCNVACTWDGSWNSFQSGPVIAEMTTNNNYTGLNINPNVTLFSGNAGMNGVSVSPTIGGMGYSSTFNGVYVSPQTSTVYSAFGINVSLDNVTTFAGVQGTQTKQDLTFTFIAVGEDANTYTLEYIGGGTAGSEVVSNILTAYTVQIDSGVSTATQIKAALDASSPWNALVTTTISGVGSNPQVTAAATPFAGGLWAGSKKAGYFDGDVEITGALAFSGALSTGAINSFGAYSLVSGAGNPPQGVSSLVTAPTVAASATLTGADIIGVNTAMLLDVGASASVSTAFIGIAALGLPAVITMGAGSTVDKVSGAVYAISLDAGAGGGTIDTVSLCRSVAIPNGTTTVNRLYGYEFDLPFGAVGTDHWGLYIKTASATNWIEGSLRIGGTTLTDDIAAYDLHVDGDAFFENGNLGFYGTTPVAQQASSGPATAGGTYTATEQAMLQEAYDALRAYGLLT